MSKTDSKIIIRSENLKLIYDEFQGYAVFKRICYPSGSTAFWQQITKWYSYKKYAMDLYMKTLYTGGKTE